MLIVRLNYLKVIQLKFTFGLLEYFETAAQLWFPKM